MSTFQKLIDQRKKQNVKQYEMAKHLGITKSTLCKYEKGTRDISAEQQDAYAAYLGFELLILKKI